MEVFRRFFERIVEECFAAGLVWGEELFFDSTKVEANASLDSAGSRALLEGRLQGHLEATFPEGASSARDEAAVELGPANLQERRELARANVDRHRWIEKNGRQQRGLIRRGYARMAHQRVSTTYLDASPMHQKKKGASKLGYQTHYG